MTEDITDTFTDTTEEQTMKELATRANALATDLTSLEETDVVGDSGEIGVLRNALKNIEDTAEEVRKMVEKRLEQRMEPGDSITLPDGGKLTLIESHNKWVANDEAAEEIIRERGGDPQDAMEFNTSQLADLLMELGVDPEKYVGESHYTYFR